MTLMTPTMPAIAQTLSASVASPLQSNIPAIASSTLADIPQSQAFTARADYLAVTAPRVQTWISTADVLRGKTRWVDQTYREAYAEAAVEQGIAWQVRINRERRGMSQAELARRMDTKQSAISRLEDPGYGAHSLAQLQKVARAFDCALIVKLAAYSTLALESHHLSEDDLFVPGYQEELQD